MLYCWCMTIITIAICILNLFPFLLIPTVAYMHNMHLDPPGPPLFMYIQNNINSKWQTENFKIINGMMLQVVEIMQEVLEAEGVHQTAHCWAFPLGGQGAEKGEVPFLAGSSLASSWVAFQV